MSKSAAPRREPRSSRVRTKGSRRAGLMCMEADWIASGSTLRVFPKGNTVKEIAAPCYPEDCLGINPANVQAKNVGGSWKVVDGNHWMMDFGSKQANAKK